MLPGAWGHVKLAWVWKVYSWWGWLRDLQPKVTGTSLSCAGLDWVILAWLESLSTGDVCKVSQRGGGQEGLITGALAPIS